MYTLDQHTCKKCGEVFDITTWVAGDAFCSEMIYRATCPHCQAAQRFEIMEASYKVDWLPVGTVPLKELFKDAHR